MTITYHLNIINTKQQIFSNLIKKIQITNNKNKLNIYPNHTPLLTTIKPDII
ncbi:F0F1 ATP synthase subunit epsilon, partial [Bacillus thuringiensis]|nr:F0F1 ATP synthase subunit epsilon [Bacillus thuringiensis]